MNGSSKPRVCFVLPGLHSVSRGAETAFESVADELARNHDFEITLIGSGAHKQERAYHYVRARAINRGNFERWPCIPPLRNEYRWEEFTFATSLWFNYRPEEFDVNVTCSYPFTNWVLRARDLKRKSRHVFVTQNGDWPPRRNNAEYKIFSCDALICTNPEYFNRHKETWRSCLIPNGFDPSKMKPGTGDRSRFGIPIGLKVVLIVSSLIPSKRVLAGLRAVAKLPDTFLVVAGDGPLRREFLALAKQLLPKRHLRLSVSMDDMPALYQCADALLHMSRHESFGNIYVEAMGSGLPVVAHDSETQRWIFESSSSSPVMSSSTHEQNPENLAWLVDTGNIDAISKALDTALRCSRSTALSQHRKAAQRFSWKIVADQYADFLTEVAQS